MCKFGSYAYVCDKHVYYYYGEAFRDILDANRNK